jgi:putative OPT family oligopeptide transporter
MSEPNEATSPIPELTVKAVLLGIVLTVILAAANAYLGLFAGMTVSASIPAAVISMGVLRLFKSHSIQENNAVQTAASAGESLAAGVIFTLPALLLMHHWSSFDYVTTTLIAGMGGLLGVLFTIPLRRSMIVDSSDLQFPEGTATAEVLRSGQRGDGLKEIAVGGAIGGLFKLFAGGFKLFPDTAAWATRVGENVFFVGSTLSPALLSVGYIVGLNIAALVFIGGALSWYIAIPAFLAIQGVPAGMEAAGAADLAYGVWNSQIRYLGVGAMAVGGLWALFSLRKSLISGITGGIASYKALRQDDAPDVPRTERDIPMNWVLWALALSVIPLFLIYNHLTGDPMVAAVMAVVMLVAGFLFSAVAAYMAGLVGSSNNPISGITIATVLFASIVLLGLLGGDSKIGPAAAIMVAGVVCCAAAIGGDNMQDLKAGRIVGSTPWKQQVMQIVGVLSAALVIAPVLSLIHEAYVIGEGLKAPQASLMHSVAVGVFEGGLPWDMVTIGAIIAVIVIAIDEYLGKIGSEFRAPVLAVAVGIYLPLELSVPILIGGLIAFVAKKGCSRLGGEPEAQKRAGMKASHRGLLLASGLITGEALVGILMAGPIVATGDRDVLSSLLPFESNVFVALLITGAIVWYMARTAKPTVADLEA